MPILGFGTMAIGSVEKGFAVTKIINPVQRLMSPGRMSSIIGLLIFLLAACTPPPSLVQVSRISGAESVCQTSQFTNSLGRNLHFFAPALDRNGVEAGLKELAQEYTELTNLDGVASCVLSATAAYPIGITGESSTADFYLDQSSNLLCLNYADRVFTEEDVALLNSYPWRWVPSNDQTGRPLRRFVALCLNKEGQFIGYSNER